jgi:hypothetical protein
VGSASRPSPTHRGGGGGVSQTVVVLKGLRYGENPVYEMCQRFYVG